MCVGVYESATGVQSNPSCHLPVTGLKHNAETNLVNAMNITNMKSSIFFMLLSYGVAVGVLVGVRVGVNVGVRVGVPVNVEVGVGVFGTCVWII